MTAIADIINVQISANTRTPTQAGFGTPLFLTYHTRFPELVRTYSDLSEMASDGFAETDSAYLMARAAFSQSPRPEKVKIGRLNTAPVFTYTLSVNASTAGTITSLNVNGTPITHTVVGVDSTDAAVATAVSALIDAVPGVSVGVAGDVITVTPSAAGTPIHLSAPKNLTLTDNTAAAGYDTQLSAIQQVDDDWYFVATDSTSNANTLAVAAWVESRIKIHIGQTVNSVELTGSGTLLPALLGFGYRRTAMMYSQDANQYPNAAWIGRVAAKDPGSITWKFKDLAGVQPALLTTSQENVLKTNKTNYYTEVSGILMTTEGYSVSGEYLDIRHGIDWLTRRIQERVLQMLANGDKIPYTDAGVDAVLSEIYAQLEQGVSRGFLAPHTKDTPITVTAPRVVNISPTDKAVRRLPDVKFGANLAGAIHSVRIVGTLSL